MKILVSDRGLFSALRTRHDGAAVLHDMNPSPVHSGVHMARPRRLTTQASESFMVIGYSSREHDPILFCEQRNCRELIEKKMVGFDR